MSKDYNKVWWSWIHNLHLRCTRGEEIILLTGYLYHRNDQSRNVGFVIAHITEYNLVVIPRAYTCIIQLRSWRMGTTFAKQVLRARLHNIVFSL